MNRRGFLTGLGALIAAPAIVHVANIMPVKAMPSIDDLDALLRARLDDSFEITRQAIARNLYGDLCAVTRKAMLPRLLVQVYTQSPMLSFMDELRAEAAT